MSATHRQDRRLRRRSRRQGWADRRQARRPEAARRGPSPRRPPAMPRRRSARASDALEEGDRRHDDRSPIDRSADLPARSKRPRAGCLVRRRRQSADGDPTKSGTDPRAPLRVFPPSTRPTNEEPPMAADDVPRATPAPSCPPRRPHRRRGADRPPDGGGGRRRRRRPHSSAAVSHDHPPHGARRGLTGRASP